MYGPSACEQCGKLVPAQSGRAGRPKRFCSDQCTRLADAQRRLERRAAAKTTTTCPTCAKPFLPANATRRYCSDDCRMKARNKYRLGATIACRDCGSPLVLVNIMGAATRRLCSDCRRAANMAKCRARRTRAGLPAAANL